MTQGLSGRVWQRADYGRLTAAATPPGAGSKVATSGGHFPGAAGRHQRGSYQHIATFRIDRPGARYRSGQTDRRRNRRGGQAMPTLRETLLAPDIQPHVIADCEELVDREVADMSGVTGTAVRLAYKTVRTFDAGHIPAMIETILPSVADALQPYWANFAAEPSGGGFGGSRASRDDEVAEALLAITDSRQRASSRATIVKAYKTVRGSAVKHVKAALPALGALVQKHMG